MGEVARHLVSLHLKDVLGGVGVLELFGELFWCLCDLGAPSSAAFEVRGVHRASRRVEQAPHQGDWASPVQDIGDDVLEV